MVITRNRTKKPSANNAASVESISSSSTLPKRSQRNVHKSNNEPKFDQKDIKIQEAKGEPNEVPVIYEPDKKVINSKQPRRKFALKSRSQEGENTTPLKFTRTTIKTSSNVKRNVEESSSGIKATLQEAKTPKGLDDHCEQLLNNKNKGSTFGNEDEVFNCKLSESEDDQQEIKASNSHITKIGTEKGSNDKLETEGNGEPRFRRRTRQKPLKPKYTFEDSESEEDCPKKKTRKTSRLKDIELDEDEVSDFEPSKSKKDKDSSSSDYSEDCEDEAIEIKTQSHRKRKNIQKGNKSKYYQEVDSDNAVETERIINSNRKIGKVRKLNKSKGFEFHENKALSFKEAIEKSKGTKLERLNGAMKYFFGKDQPGGLYKPGTSKTEENTLKGDTPDTSCNLLDETKIESNNVKKDLVRKKLKDVSDRVADESSSESEWEEVSDVDQPMNLDDYKPEIPKEGVEINISLGTQPRRKDRRKKRQLEFANYARQFLNKFKKDTQISMHKVHLLGYISHLFYMNQIFCDQFLLGYILSILPNDFLGITTKKTTSGLLTRMIAWFRNTFVLERKESKLAIMDSLLECIQTKVVTSSENYCYLFIILGRAMKLDVRLCKSVNPVSFKTEELIKTERQKLKEINFKDMKLPSTSKTDCVTTKEENSNTENVPSKKVVKSSAAKLKETGKFAEEKKGTPKNKKMKSRKSRCGSLKNKRGEGSSPSSDDEFEPTKALDSSSEDDFQPDKSRRKGKTSRKSSSTTKKNRKILSSDPETEEDLSDGRVRVDAWAEIYLNSEGKWVCVDVVENIVNKPYDIEANVSRPICYVLSVDNDSKIKDVTQRYASGWLTHVRKLRMPGDWWEESLEPFLPPKVKREKAEDQQLGAMLMQQPMPGKIGDFKDHPLYVLKRHLLKYQAIYPPDAPSLGFIRGEPVYARECVRTLHSRETWRRQGITVKPDEEPYKLVKARPRWDKVNKRIYNPEAPMDVYGEWQTEPYVPPPCKDGKVPRNEYGNVELFTASMLPKGAVQLRLPGLNRIARKLGIDCAPAMIGFDGSAHVGIIPMFDGFVVCNEYKDTLIAAWDEEQVNIARREKEKYEKRVFGNWRKLIRGLLIREKIKSRYFGGDKKLEGEGTSAN